MQTVVIVGGGFAGVRCALDLARRNSLDTKIVLISDKPHFEYSPALYKVAAGCSPFEVCVPLSEIFSDTCVEVNRDRIERVDLRKQRLFGTSGARYAYDILVLALGSETTYFHIPGLSELSFGMKSIHDALRLRRHLHEVLETARGKKPDVQVSSGHILVVGGGATGCELAGALAGYAQAVARSHRVTHSLVTIDLIEAAPRLLPALPEKFSKRVEVRLRSIGVNIFLNRTLVEREVEEVHLKDMEMKTKTLIWTAGVKPCSLYGSIAGLKLDKRGRVEVDAFLRAKGWKNVFVAGDGAATEFSGFAQTALAHGRCIASFLARRNRQSGKTSVAPPATFGFRSRTVASVLPIGPSWAAAQIGGFQFFGRPAWWLRRLIDFRFFLSILPVSKAWLAFRSGKVLAETCDVCTGENAYKDNKR